MEKELREKWYPILGFEGVYEISENGEVRSLDRTIENARTNSGFATYKGKLLKPVYPHSNNDYYGYYLSKSGVQKWYSLDEIIILKKTDTNTAINDILKKNNIDKSMPVFQAMHSAYQLGEKSLAEKIEFAIAEYRSTPMHPTELVEKLRNILNPKP